MAETLEIKIKVDGADAAKKEFQSLSAGLKKSASDMAASVQNAFGSKGFHAGVANLKQGISGVSDQMMHLSTIAATTFAGAGFAAIKTAADFEQIEIALQGALGSTDEAAKTFKRLKKEAAATPFTFKGLSNYVTLLSTVTKDGDRAVDLVMSLGDALSFAGKGEEELSRVVANMQQIKSVGKASLGDLRQFGFAGIPIFELLQKELGVTGEKLAEMTEEGKITFEVLEAAFSGAAKEGGQFANSMKRQSTTLNGIFSNIGDTIELALNDIARESGVFDIVKEGATKFLKVLQDNVPTISNFIKNEFIPNLKTLAENIWSVVGPVLEWIKNNPDLVKQLLDIGAKLFVLNTALRIGQFLFGNVLTVVAGLGQMALPVLATAFTTIGTAITGTVIPAIVSLLVAAGPFLLGGAVIVGVLAGAAAFGDAWLKNTIQTGNALEGLKKTITDALGLTQTLTKKTEDARVKAVQAQVANAQRAYNIASGRKFAGGGIVPGNSFSGDKVSAQVNSGEMILNSGQQAALFKMISSMANGGGGRTVNFNGPVNMAGNRGAKQQQMLLGNLIMNAI